PSNVQNFHQVQPLTHSWTKDHPLDQVIGDPSKPVMTRQRLHTDSKVCMYALTVSTIEPKNIKKAMVKKASYGLKQAPCAWYDKLSYFLIEHGFTKDFSKRFANLMKNNFEMSMMGELKFFLGLQVHQSPRGIFISQSQYAIELLKKHGLDECVSMTTPMATERLDADLQGTPTDQTTYRRMIGGLMYLTTSRPDIAYATFDSRFELIAYSDADHAGCKDECKSTSKGLKFLGGKLVSWISKKQDYTAMSTAEAEYIPMYCDSKSAIAISCNPVPHSKTKHIDIRYHFIKEHVEKGTVEFYFVGTEYQLTDLFTKALPKESFEYLVHHIASSFVPWIYMAQFWHTFKEDGSKYRLMFMLDKKELSLTLDDFREGIHYSLLHYTSLIPYPIFSKIIIEEYKDKVGMKIPDWMITKAMKKTKHYMMYAEVFGIDVPLIQSSPTESTQGTHRTPSAPRSPTLKVDAAESNTLQASLAEHKSRQEHEARENVALVEKHLASEEIEKMVEGQEHVVDDSSIPRNDENTILGTRFAIKFQDDPYADAHPEGEKSAKLQKTSEHETYVSRESSSGQDNKKEQGPSTSGNQEQADDYDFWIDSYASDDDEIPTKQVSQDIIEERDPEAPALSLINQDLLYLKKGNLGPEKIVLSLHKFPAVVFNDDDIEEETSRWVNKKQKELEKPKEVIYSNSKIIQVIKTYWELGYEHKFITKIITRRANDCIVLITEPNFKNLNKNDIKDMYLLTMNRKEARTRQKSYADKHRRSLEFQPGDYVFLKVSPARGVRHFEMIEVTNEKVAVAKEKLKEARSPARGVRRFGIKGKLSPCFIGPFEILDRVGEVSYRLALPPQLSHVHNVFYVSLIRADLSYVKEPEAILDRQDRVMRKKTIPSSRFFGGTIPSGKPLRKPRSLSGLLILISFHDLVCSIQLYHVSNSRTNYSFKRGRVVKPA
nr:hypothetical protein [Tanacetum cinerariifolium]